MGSKGPITAPKIRMAFVNEARTDGHRSALAVMIDVPWRPNSSETDVCCYSMRDMHSSCCIKYARLLTNCTGKEQEQLLNHLKTIYNDQEIEVVDIATTATWETKA